MFLNQSIETIRKDTDRDNFMTGDQAQAYGLIDSTLLHRGESGEPQRT